jgi:hypothetical protein
MTDVTSTFSCRREEDKGRGVPANLRTGQEGQGRRMLRGLPGMYETVRQG